MARRIAMAMVLVAGGCSSSGGEAQESPRVVSRNARRSGQAPPASTTTTTQAPPAPPSTVVRSVPTTSVRPVAPPPPGSTVPPPAPQETGGAATHGRASWYARGTTTASGERFDPDGLTYASRSHAFGTMTEFCHAGRCVVARCTDRGPAEWTGRSVDLSRAAFASIAPLSAGVVDVTWTEAA